MRLVLLPPAHSVLLHGSIFELQAGVHAEFQHWLLREAGIGSGAGAIERHFAATTALLAAGRTQEAADALALLHYAFTDTLEQFSPLHLAFGCLVAEVDGVPITDRSEAGLTRLLAELSAWGLTQALVAEEVAAVKKNCLPS